MPKSKHETPPIETLYKSWFQEYSTYVVLHRAIPNIEDGLKPSQRRCLHALKELDDGRYNKLANVVGHTMAYHPHGDQNLVDTFVNIAQKNWLLDTQGNWGNTITGEPNAAQRYIECRLSPFAKNNLFSHKITLWKKSYDGRRDEPIFLPAKFPILLLQGTEGIAVGLACSILPHNFQEITKACIAHLQGKPFSLLPDFPTGGDADTSSYLDGTEKGKIRIRAKITPHGKNQLIISELPFGVTSTSLIENIAAVAQKGKIKIKEIEDLSVENPEVVITLQPGSCQEKSREALFAFTKCEVSKSTNTVVLKDGKPWFCSTSDLLKETCNHIKNLLAQELQVQLQELDEKILRLQLEALFIEKEIYQLIKPANSQEEANEIITKALQKEISSLRRHPTNEEITALSDIRMRKIASFDKFSHQKNLEKTLKEEKSSQQKLKKITKTTIAHFQNLLETYGEENPRKTRIHPQGFKKIDLAEIDAQSMPLFWNPKTGFLGTNLKKEQPLPFQTNPQTDIGTINQQGLLKINKVSEKTFFNENLLEAFPILKNGQAPTWYLIYQDKTTEKTFAKAFHINAGFIRDKDYPLAGNNPKNKVLFLKNYPPNQTPPTLEIQLDPKCRAKIKTLTIDLKDLSPKTREAKGNTISKYPIKKIKEI